MNARVKHLLAGDIRSRSITPARTDQREEFGIRQPEFEVPPVAGPQVVGGIMSGGEFRGCRGYLDRDIGSQHVFGDGDARPRTGRRHPE